MPKFVVINKTIYLWEKETKNQEEERSTQEVMVKEDLEGFLNPLVLLKLKQKAKNKKG